MDLSEQENRRSDQFCGMPGVFWLTCCGLASLVIGVFWLLDTMGFWVDYWIDYIGPLLFIAWGVTTIFIYFNRRNK